MVVRSLDVNNDPFRPRESNEDILGPDVPYLSAIGALMYLASHTRPDISFSVNLLARFSSCPTRRHWNGIKQYFVTSKISNPDIQEDCGLSSEKLTPTVLYEDNAACIAQLSEGYIKGDRTKHISPKFFFTHELQKSGDIDVQQVRLSENLADLFTKALPTATFKRLVRQIGMRSLKELH
ncbi:uncharacterized protein LOC130591432 [Beta vulgaris subsp. vulgaris]|uniref:uncharacterized protein LOC130591432 n=1 Tax=Beta vulgaris subsp. vulgaris TaxID=3555 RepID=UPI002548B562|nr:uncharacterized protein LOC130591432 [Beta vulgaris subsp. vulgaris]